MALKLITFSLQINEWKMGEGKDMKIKSKMEIDPARQMDSGTYECMVREPCDSLMKSLSNTHFSRQTTSSPLTGRTSKPTSRNHLPSFILHNLNVVSGARVEAIVRQGAPEV